MPETKRKEYLSLAYIRALSSKADALMDIIREDSDSSDVLIKKLITTDKESYWGEVVFQLKSTSSKTAVKEDDQNIFYNLKVKNYKDLIKRAVSKKYLALLILPEEENEWLDINVERIIMKKCMYWVSLLGMPDTSNTSGITVTIPKSNLLNADSLIQLIKQSVDKI